MTVGENIGKKVLIEVLVLSHDNRDGTTRIKIGNDDIGTWVYSKTPCYPLPVEVKRRGGSCRHNGSYGEACGVCTNYDKWEPTFQIGDDVEGSDDGTNWYRGEYLIKKGDQHFVQQGSKAWSWNYVRRIPAKPSLEQVIENALEEYEEEIQASIDDAPDSKTIQGVRNGFVSRLKAAIEEAGK